MIIAIKIGASRELPQKWKTVCCAYLAVAGDSCLPGITAFPVKSIQTILSCAIILNI